jgi:hypothetical protein
MSQSAKKPEPATSTAPAERRARVVSDASKAATIFNKLCQLDFDEQEELKESPESIKRKYAQRRSQLLGDDVSPEVARLVEKMRA